MNSNKQFFNKNTTKRLVVVVCLFVLAMTVVTLAHAAPPTSPAPTTGILSLKGIVAQLIEVVNAFIPLLFGFALIGFIIGVIRFLFSKNPDEIGKIKGYLIYSIIAIAVMLSVWSLALLLKNSFFPSASTPTFEGDYNKNIAPSSLQNGGGSLNA